VNDKNRNLGSGQNELAVPAASGADIAHALAKATLSLVLQAAHWLN
jgi:hypothetical protein